MNRALQTVSSYSCLKWKLSGTFLACITFQMGKEIYHDISITLRIMREKLVLLLTELPSTFPPSNVDV